MKPLNKALLHVLFASFLSLVCFGQSTDFVYQGRLIEGSVAPTGNYDLQFSLWSAVAGGTQIGTTQTLMNVAVSSGTFSVQLSFGANNPTIFPGAPRFLEIAAKPSGGGAYTPLSPRQQFTSTPYSIRSLASGTADSLTSSCSLCIADSQIAAVAGSKIVGPVTSATTANTAGSVTGVVAIANGGTGSSTKNFVDLTTNQLSISGRKAFSNLESVQFDAVTARVGDQLTVGPVGGSFLSEIRNDYVKSNRVDARSFSVEGQTLLSSLFADTGLRLGIDTGFTTPNFSTVLGNRAGRANGSTATGGVFVGYEAGEANVSGDQNTFVGYRSGELNTDGFINTFVGAEAGRANLSGSRNTAIGWRADVGSGALTNATAIGAGVIVTTSNTVAIGRSTDSVVMSNLTVTPTAVLIPNLAAYSPLGGNVSLCRNAVNQISNCPPPPASLSEDLQQVRAENRDLKVELQRQQATINALKALVCSQNRTADICKVEN